MENINESTSTIPSEATLADDVKNFYKKEFKDLFLTIFTNPIDGIYNLFKNPTSAVYKNSLILYSSVFVLFIVGIFIIVGDYRQGMDFGDFFKLSLIPVLFMFTISLLSFGIKSVSGKPNFKNELQTGAISGIPVAMLVPVAIILKSVMSIDNIFSIASSPTQVGFIGFILLLYIVLMFINIFQQSLKASGTKDALAWYISPIAVFAAFYITDKIIESMF